MNALAYHERKAAGGAHRPASSFTTAGGPTSTTYSALLRPSTRTVACTSLPPRGPLTLPGSPGNHWYVVPRVGYPDSDTFHTAYAKLAEFHDELWQRSGMPPKKTVLGGFSMGSVMSYSLGLAADQPPTRWRSSLSPASSRPWRAGSRRLGDRIGLHALIAHGRRDPIIEVGFAQRARDLLAANGLDVAYHESDAAHHIDPRTSRRPMHWLSRVIAPFPAGELA